MISKELRNNPTCILVLNLALGDLLISLVVNSFAVVGKQNSRSLSIGVGSISKYYILLKGVIAGKVFFDHHWVLCKIIGALCLIGNYFVILLF